jgi:hypothetical protein
VGAGDGRLLVNCALKSEARCIGVEIDEDRAAEAVEVNNYYYNHYYYYYYYYYYNHYHCYNDYYNDYRLPRIALQLLFIE